MLHEVNVHHGSAINPLTISSPRQLTHNVHGPHDEKFYKFLAGLEDEYDALQRSGYAGEGFYSPGHRLGAGVSHDLPPHLARVRLLEAAERRRKAETLTKGGGRLGGRSGALERLSPRELAARVSFVFSKIHQSLPDSCISKAAERRKRDEVTCGSGSLALREAAKAAETSAVNEVLIDLTNDDDDTLPTHSTPGSKPGPSQPTTRATRERDTVNTPTGRRWTCPVCTLINADPALQCDACLAVRPIDTSVGWACATCGERDMAHEFWSCRFCGAVKNHS